MQLQYAGIYALDPHWAAQRASDGWLVINVDAHDKLPSDPSGDIPKSYVAVGNTDREKSYFFNMYLRDSRALDYLLTRPDWDGNNCVDRGKQGGQQSFALAGCARRRSRRCWSASLPARIQTAICMAARVAFPIGLQTIPRQWRPPSISIPSTSPRASKAPVMAGMGFIDTFLRPREFGQP